MDTPSGEQAGLIAGQFSCIDDGCQSVARPVADRFVPDLRLIAARGVVARPERFCVVLVGV